MKKVTKFYPLIVGCVILISAAAYGTRAYFSDSTQEEVGIELTLGHVEVASSSGEWIYETSDLNENIEVKAGSTAESKTPVTLVLNNDNKLGKYVSITNARPGDSFSKTFTFKNTGSLDQKVTFSSIDNEAEGLFNITWDKIIKNDLGQREIPNNGYIFLAPNESLSTTLKVTVDNSSNEEFKNTGSANKEGITPGLNELNLLKETVEVTAVQTNAN